MNRVTDDFVYPLVAIGLAAVILLLGVAVGSNRAYRAAKIEAVKQGHAVWVTSVEGQVTFKWKEAAK